MTAAKTRVDAVDLDTALLPVVGNAMTGLVRILRVFRDQRETILIGGPTGERAKRKHPFHDCAKYDCDLPKPQGFSLVRKVG